MLRRAKELNGFTVQATDGAAGKIRDICFDDQDWIVRYLVVDTGGRLEGRRVRLSPVAVAETL